MVMSAFLAVTGVGGIVESERRVGAGAEDSRSSFGSLAAGRAWVEIAAAIRSWRIA
jgi:hypothetical protein